MPRVLNKKHDLIPLGDSVFIGRPSPWGNPFVIGRDGTREEVVAKFAYYLASNPDLLERVRLELKGKDLVCFCSPELCHGDILLHFANFSGHIKDD
jgi:hypothetical protein